MSPPQKKHQKTKTKTKNKKTPTKQKRIKKNETKKSYFIKLNLLPRSKPFPFAFILLSCLEGAKKTRGTSHYHTYTKSLADSSRVVISFYLHLSEISAFTQQLLSGLISDKQITFKRPIRPKTTAHGGLGL